MKKLITSALLALTLSFGSMGVVNAGYFPTDTLSTELGVEIVSGHAGGVDSSTGMHIYEKDVTGRLTEVGSGIANSTSSTTVDAAGDTIKSESTNGITINKDGKMFTWASNRTTNVTTGDVTYDNSDSNTKSVNLATDDELAAGLSTLNGDIANNTATIIDNKRASDQAFASQARYISENQDAIGNNSSHIDNNTATIAANKVATDIAIGDNAANISDNQLEIDVNTVNIAGNTDLININKVATDTAIAGNTSTINSNQAYNVQENERQDVYAVDTRNQAQANTAAIGEIKWEIQGIQQHLDTLDGMVAANAATSSMILPRAFDGRFAVQVGLGNYRGHNALALGMVTMPTDKVAVRVTVAGSDADNFNDLVVGGSVNFGW